MKVLEPCDSTADGSSRPPPERRGRDPVDRLLRSAGLQQRRELVEAVAANSAASFFGKGVLARRELGVVGTEGVRRLAGWLVVDDGFVSRRSGRPRRERR